MSKKDFERIAATLRSLKPSSVVLPGQSGVRRASMAAQWVATVTAFEKDLAATNPRFDGGRFAAACGLLDNEAKGGRS